MGIGWSRIVILLATCAVCMGQSWAQDAGRQSPAKSVGARPDGLVQGGAFIDLILPIPVDDGLVSDCWGGDNVKPRVVGNGIEDTKWSYWCASRIFGPDGKEHLFTVRWPQEKGHKYWVRSAVVHAVADKPTGPFKVIEELGPGHNVDVYQARDGTYVVSVSGRSYLSKELHGPWKSVPAEFDMKESSMSNKTFARREDGSFLLVMRSGSLWLSNDGLHPYRRIFPTSVYPFERARGSTAFEDPVIWKDEVQYYMIVNNWPNRTAFHGRSRDGLHWVWDPGTAFDNNVVRHPDGTIEGWNKIERPKVRQDEFGRATHMYLAVIDCPKDQCDGTNSSSSKSVVVPLLVGRRLAILNEQAIGNDTREIRVEIKAEPGFDPNQDVELESLRFGAPEQVDFGKGCKAIRSDKSGANLIVTFDGTGNGLKSGEHAAKLLGKTVAGGLLYGYARLPGVTVLQPMVVARMPRMERRVDGTLAIAIPVENVGLAPSTTPLPVTMTLREVGQGRAPGKEIQSGSATVPVLKTYESANVELIVPAAAAPAGSLADIEVVVNPSAPGADTFLFKKNTVP